MQCCLSVWQCSALADRPLNGLYVHVHTCMSLFCVVITPADLIDLRRLADGRKNYQQSYIGSDDIGTLRSSKIQHTHTHTRAFNGPLSGTTRVSGWLGSRVVSVLDLGAEGPGFKSQSRRCRVTVLWAYYNCDTSTIRLRFEYDTTSYEELCAFEQ